MASFVKSKGELRDEYKAIAEDLIDTGWFLPTKPRQPDKREEFPQDLSGHPLEELGYLMGYYSQYEAYARSKAGIAQAVMIIVKEEQLEESDEQVHVMNEVVLKLEAAGRIAARMEGRRYVYKYAEADFKKFDGLYNAYRIMKEAISREITRRDQRDRITSVTN